MSLNISNNDSMDTVAINENAEQENLVSVEHEIEMITQQAEKTIVIHAGSSQLRIGRASDPQPVLVPHAIAWRRKEQMATQMQILRKKSLLDNDKLNSFSSTIGFTTDMLKKIQERNKRKKAESLPEMCSWTWTNTLNNPSFLIGDDALYIDEKDCYDIFWPIVDGQLNVAEKSVTAVLADIEALWTKAIENFLHISRKELCDYRCILIVPDIYIRKHIKMLMNTLFTYVGFNSILVHQESVCATYGCGIANACVVDVGHQKTSVTCVEDGFSHPDTRVTINVGGCDITSVFACLLKHGGFPYRSCNFENRMDALLLQELKETYCHLDTSKTDDEEQEFTLRRPGQKSQLFSMILGAETMLSPIVLFYPQVFHELKSHFWAKSDGDSSDPFDESYLASTRTKLEEAWATKRERAAAKSEEKHENVDSVNNDLHGLSLDEMIVWSIEQCLDSYNDEVKRRMYSCILLVGGGLANYEGVEELVKEKVLARKPSPSVAMDVHVITKPKDQDPGIIAWKGGAVLSSLENSQELWLTKNDWFKHGVKLLRENCAFLW